MRNIYPKFSLAWIFVLILSLSSFGIGSDKPLNKDKENDKPVRNDRPRKVETLLNAPKTKRKVLNVIALLPSKGEEETRALPALIEPLTAKGVKLIPTNPNKTLGPDPFMFTISSDKDSVGIGEEFELTVRVNWVDYGVNNGIKFLPEWYKYVLKVAMPKGFIKTGGDYTDYCTKPVDANNQEAIFTIKGKFEYTPEETIFKVLRGFEGAGNESAFILKGEKRVILSFRRDEYHHQNIKNARVVQAQNGVTVEVIKQELCNTIIQRIYVRLANTNTQSVVLGLFWHHVGTTDCSYANFPGSPGIIKTLRPNVDTTIILNRMGSYYQHLDVGYKLDVSQATFDQFNCNLGFTGSTIVDLTPQAPIATYSDGLRTLEATGCTIGSTYEWNDLNTNRIRTLNEGDYGQYKARCKKDGCTSVWSNEVGGTAPTNEPTSITVAPYTYCADNVKLTVSGCSSPKSRWYTQWNGSSYGQSEDVTGYEFRLYKPYNNKVKVVCLTGTTESTPIDKTVNTNDVLALKAPTSITFDKNPVNTNESVDITVSGCKDNTDPAWSTDNINFTIIPSNQTHATSSFSASTTIYARCQYGSVVGCSSETISQLLSVTSTGCTSYPAKPTGVSVSPNNYNTNNIPASVTLSATCAGGSNVVWNRSGTPAPTVTTTFTARCEDANGCTSNGETVTVTVGDPPPPPACGTPSAPTTEGYNKNVCLDDNKTIFLYARTCETGATPVWSDGHEGEEYQIAGNSVFSRTLTARCRRTCSTGGYSYSVNSDGVSFQVIDCEVTLPVPNVEIYNPFFCAGTDQAYLYARGCANGQTIVWSNGYTKLKSAAVDDEYITGSRGSYSAKCRDSRNRESNSSNTVFVDARVCPPGCTDPNITKPNAPSIDYGGYNTKLCPDSKRPAYLYARGCATGQTIVWSNGFTKVRTNSDDEELLVWARDLIRAGINYYTVTARCKNNCGTSSASNPAVIEIVDADKPILKSNSSLADFGVEGGIETGDDLHVWVEPNAPALYKDFKWTFNTNPAVISTTDKVDILNVRDNSTGTYKISLKTGDNECVVTQEINVVIKPWQCKLTMEATPSCYIQTNKRWAKLGLKLQNRTKRWGGAWKVQRVKDLDGNAVTDAVLFTGSWKATLKDSTIATQDKIADGIYEITLIERRSDEETGEGFVCEPAKIYITVGCQRKCKTLKPCVTGDCCGIPANIDLNDEIKLETLAVNDVVKVNDFEMIVTKIITAPTAPTYQCNIEGITKVPVFDNVFIGLKTDITKTPLTVFNECKELVGGEIITLYNPANWDKPIQAKAIAKAIYESAKDVLDVLTSDSARVDMKKEDLANVAQQMREQAAKDLPKELETKALEAVRKMEEAQAEYQKARDAGNQAAKDAATTKFALAKAELDAVKAATLKYLNMYQNIVQKTLTKMSNDFSSVPDDAPTTIATVDEQPTPIDDVIPIAQATWITPALRNTIVAGLKVDADKNLKRLFKIFIRTHNGNAIAIKDLEQKIRVTQKTTVLTPNPPLLSFSTVSPVQKLSDYIYTTMCKTCTGTDPLEQAMINTTEKALSNRINELFTKIVYTQD